MGINLADKPGASLSHSALAQDEICNGHSVILIHIACERSQSAVWHPDRNSRHVLKRIWHGEQKDVHGTRLAFSDRTISSGRFSLPKAAYPTCSDVPASFWDDVCKAPFSVHFC